ncbi:hypothetical protein M0804_004293 [Polistes exclamans]|nr:hypothetical protein M0804_004293 [Polistes exclamans]
MFYDEDDEYDLMIEYTILFKSVIFEISDGNDEDVPLHFKAFQVMETGLGWFETYKEWYSADLLVLKRLCDFAVKKIWNS